MSVLKLRTTHTAVDARMGAAVGNSVMASVAPVAPLADRVLNALRAGGTVHSVAVQCETSEIFVKTMMDHYERLGFLTGAQSLCSSGLGACSTSYAELSTEARIHCAGCPLTV